MYEFKEGSRIKADANVAGAMCEQLEKTIGLTPKTLLDANRAEDAPLHSCFEWNDGEAAEKYRESQARHIINCLCIKTGQVEQPTVRAFFNIQKTSYESTGVIIRQEDKYAQLLDMAKKELSAFQQKYKTLSELQTVFDVIEQLKAG